MVVVPEPPVEKSTGNRFGVGALLVVLFAYLVPFVSAFGLASLDELAANGIDLIPALAFIGLLSIGFVITIPLALVSVVFAVISILADGRNRKLAILSLTLAAVLLLGACVLSVGYLTFIPLPW